MVEVLRNIGFKWYVIITVLIVPFHIIEEVICNFPLWMYEHYRLPKILSYPHWLINNCIFLSFLIIGLTIYLRSKEKMLLFGLGILFFGALINSIEHVSFTLIDMKLSPGFFTALLF